MFGVVGTRTLPRRHRQAIARVTVSALVASLPLLYLSLLRPPPAALAGDTAFWFLMSNCVIAAIVATADDAGALFFGSSNDDDPCNDVAAVNDPAVVTMKVGGVQEEVAGTGSNPMGLVASPFLIPAETETGGDAANRVGTDLQPNHMHVSVLLQRDEQHEPATIEPTADKNNPAVTMAVMEGHGEEDGEIASPTPASGGALAEPPEPETEPWVVPKLLTSKSLPDQEVQEEEEAADEEWPVALYSRPPDIVAHGMGEKLRRSATDGSKSVAEESEYWQLSDEELNRRVEDFIARFNKQMRLQIEQEAGV
ncbi:hypothetical protein SORBI_3001G155900 [Sorghum bicolor]|jgi:hypothetical protein|uniref:DUF4408 domain-containing protein n=2 Tax=Sorghum bicolor TaxID=4558 RepID=C5WR72_SORBI|nr:hypothetical protein SORBI_3001G155900 [Sorghum bicolor]